MTENEKREFDHLLGGIKLIIKMHDDTPPHGRFGLPQFQVEAVSALVKQLEAQEKEMNQLKVEIDLLAALRSAADASAGNWKAEAINQQERANELKSEIEWRDSSLDLFRKTETKLAAAIKAKCQETVELKELILKLEQTLQSTLQTAELKAQ